MMVTTLCDIESPLAEDCGVGWDWAPRGEGFGRTQTGEITVKPLAEGQIFRVDAGPLVVTKAVAEELRRQFSDRIRFRPVQPAGLVQLVPTSSISVATERDEDDEMVLSTPLRSVGPIPDDLVVTLEENENYVLIKDSVAKVLQRLEPALVWTTVSAA